MDDGVCDLGIARRQAIFYDMRKGVSLGQAHVGWKPDMKIQKDVIG